MPKLRANEKPFVKFTTWPVHTFLMMVLTSLWTPEWISFSWFYSGVCQPLELDPWNSPKEVVPRSFQNGWQNHLDMGGFNFNDAYPTIFSWRCFWLQKDIHREFLWNWGIGRTHCWWLSAALNEQRLSQNLLPFPCLKYIWKEQWTRPWVFIVSRGLYFPGIYIHKYILKEPFTPGMDGMWLPGFHFTTINLFGTSLGLGEQSKKGSLVVILLLDFSRGSWNGVHGMGPYLTCWTLALHFVFVGGKSESLKSADRNSPNFCCSEFSLR